MFDQHLERHFKWGLLIVTFLLCLLGLATLYSAVTAVGEESTQKALYIKQMIWMGIGFILLIISLLFSYKQLEKWGSVIYFGCIILLIAVLMFGKVVGGSRRWLVLGFITVQPSELVKIGVVIILSKYYSKKNDMGGLTIKELVIPFVLVIIPFFLVVKQPDLGTGLIILLIASSMTMFVKIEKRTLSVIISLLTVIIPLVWFFLKGYQKQRILTFINPERDPLGAGYHIIQSKIAIGSGMISGRGFLKGTQNALSFLPEQHTDFIMSVLAEEWGFIGAGITILLYLILIILGLNVAHNCRDSFGLILSIGIVALLFWQVFINVGMVMGLMPVVGVPLPLVSYGGSSVLTTMLGISILINIGTRRLVVEE